MKFHLTAAAALLAIAPLAQAQVTSPNPDSRTTPAEISRGVPAVDVDTRTSAGSATNAVPGVDVDVGNPARNRVPLVDDTRRAGAAGTMRDEQRMGAGADTQLGADQRAGMRADRN
ncbi:hypothetical protein [Ramlibacter rhizophilus]|uniref:DUF4148 domain-containing protein n=1 Tax=Ramlibacter rhizophilus TaxID=1781167 RepID=A0A4Z0BSL2_9BURK|nr:hypothetical protein [Ramlibacter rhizophilus]TFZ01248.1 hypothetical protein EZ242_07655 [Ramlibacter rhizophilus]